MVTKPTGNPRGRPRKPKQTAKPAHRPKVPFIEDPDRYYIAAYRATKDTGLPGKWFATLQCGNRLDPADIPPEIHAQGREGYRIVGIGPLGNPAKGTIRDTKVRPNVWHRDNPKRAWPVTTAGRDRTFRAKEKAVYSSGDLQAINWLSNMTAAFWLAFTFAAREDLHGSRDHIDAFKRTVMKHAKEARDEQGARDKIVPIIDMIARQPDARLNG